MLRLCSRKSFVVVGLVAIYFSASRLSPLSLRQYLSRFPAQKSSIMAGTVDVLNADVALLRSKLQSGELQSVDLVAAYLKQINKHNADGAGLKALISVAPEETVLSQARHLDEERKTKGTRGPFHGIPIIVKDTMLTEASLGMDTTCGTLGLIGAKGRKNADVVELLLKAGMIILGKANLSELNLFKASPPNTAGWSSAGGQCSSPYVEGGVLPNATFLGHSTPAGSSSGSAAAVAAGFAPIALGAETDGSLVQPTSRAGLYALKPTPGTVSVKGVLALPTYDAIGPIARTAKDVADMLTLLTGTNLSHESKISWDGLRVGFVDYDIWAPATFVVEPVESFTSQTKADIEAVAAKISSLGGKVVRDVPLPPFGQLTEIIEQKHNVNPDDLWGYGFRDEFDAFVSLYETSQIRSLAELVQFNKDHADRCLPADHPSQAFLETALEEKADPEIDTKVAKVKKTAQALIDEVLAKYEVDVILAQSDGRMASVAAAAGYSVAALPVGYADFNGRAWGVNAIAGADGESKLLDLMSAWEATFPEARKAPPKLMEE
ncbi:hypothetical protein SMAC4_07005 [Sordaria macrospora]|nr:hypothetical protein SMAC4_07005 [Sordaria macrospora]